MSHKSSSCRRLTSTAILLLFAGCNDAQTASVAPESVPDRAMPAVPAGTAGTSGIVASIETVAGRPLSAATAEHALAGGQNGLAPGDGNLTAPDANASGGSAQAADQDQTNAPVTHWASSAGSGSLGSPALTAAGVSTRITAPGESVGGSVQSPPPSTISSAGAGAVGNRNIGGAFNAVAPTSAGYRAIPELAAGGVAGTPQQATTAPRGNGGAAGYSQVQLFGYAGATDQDAYPVTNPLDRINVIVQSGSIAECVPWNEIPNDDFPATSDGWTVADMVGGWVGTATAPQAWHPNHWMVELTFTADQFYRAVSDRDCPAFYYGAVNGCAELRHYTEGTIDIPFDYGPSGCGLPAWRGRLTYVATSGPRMRLGFMTDDGYGPIEYDLRRTCAE